LWIGGGVMALGALFALVPARRTGHALVVDDEVDLAASRAELPGGDEEDEREPVGVT
jgi:hypothetical protein